MKKIVAIAGIFFASAFLFSCNRQEKNTETPHGNGPGVNAILTIDTSVNCVSPVLQPRYGCDGKRLQGERVTGWQSSRVPLVYDKVISIDGYDLAHQGYRFDPSLVDNNAHLDPALLGRNGYSPVAKPVHTPDASDEYIDYDDDSSISSHKQSFWESFLSSPFADIAIPIFWIILLLLALLLLYGLGRRIYAWATRGLAHPAQHPAQPAVDTQPANNQPAPKQTTDSSQSETVSRSTANDSVLTPGPGIKERTITIVEKY